MDVVKLDPGVNLKLAVRKGREHTLTVRFVSSGQPWPIVDDFALGVKINPLDRNYLFYLSTEDEIQVNGNELVIPFSEQNTSIDASRQHYYELVNLTRKENWLQGPYIVESGQAISSPSSSSATLSVNTGDSVVEITVQGGRHESEIPLVDFSAELTFDEDKEYETVTGGATVFTLAVDGHKNGVGIIARLNTPESVEFPESFEQLPGSDDISSDHMNIIVFRYLSNYDGEGNGKVHYSITNLTGI